MQPGALLCGELFEREVSSVLVPVEVTVLEEVAPPISRLEDPEREADLAQLVAVRRCPVAMLVSASRRHGAVVASAPPCRRTPTPSSSSGSSRARSRKAARPPTPILGMVGSRSRRTRRGGARPRRASSYSGSTSKSDTAHLDREPAPRASSSAARTSGLGSSGVTWFTATSAGAPLAPPSFRAGGGNHTSVPCGRSRRMAFPDELELFGIVPRRRGHRGCGSVTLRLTDRC